MQTIRVTKTYSLSLLGEELAAQVPTFLRTRDNDDGTKRALDDSGVVLGYDGYVEIHFADDIDPGEVTAVVAAHDATKPRPDPRGDRLARIAEIGAIPRSNWTASQMRELIELLAKEHTG